MKVLPTDRAPARLSGRRLWAFRLAGLALSLLAVLGLAELAARCLGLAPPVQPHAKTALVLYYAQPTDTIRLAPNWEGYVGFVWTTINAQGFRDRLYAPEPAPGVMRVAILGDSYTMGDAVQLEDTYAKQLEARLSNQRACEVMNCGVSATNSTNQLGLLRQVLAQYRPRLIVLGYDVNDFYYPQETRFQVLERQGYRLTFHSDGRVGVEPPELSALGRIKHAVRERSYLYRWLARVRAARATAAGEPEDGRAKVAAWIKQGGHDKSFAAVAEMKKLCDDQGAAFLVAILPDLLDVPADVRSMRDYPFFAQHQLIAERLGERGVACIDLLPAFGARDPRQLTAHPFDRHFNGIGHGIIAEALLPRLRAVIADQQAALEGKSN